MGYRRRPSPLHAARAGVGCALCAALALVALLSSHPLLLGAAVVAALAVGVAAGVGAELRRVLRFALPFALLLTAINPFVSQQGLTVLARLGELPLVGRVDVTLEAAVYGGLLGLRALALILAFALFSAAVDPDELLRLLRPLSLRSALSASLATRMVPLLARDGRRIAEAQRCRPGPPPSRVALLRAVAGGALDRAVDVAAALEVRGYAGGRRPPRRRVPWSRHDLAFAAAAATVAALVVAARLTGAGAFVAYPQLEGAWGAATWALAAALVAVPLVPFLDRRGIA